MAQIDAICKTVEMLQQKHVANIKMEVDIKKLPVQQRILIKKLIRKNKNEAGVDLERIHHKRATSIKRLHKRVPIAMRMHKRVKFATKKSTTRNIYNLSIVTKRGTFTILTSNKRHTFATVNHMTHTTITSAIVGRPNATKARFYLPLH